MRYEFKLSPIGPFVVGGRSLGSNYIKSLNYIPGGVLRAALSKEIVSRCNYYTENNDGKINWVEFKGESGCSNCLVKNICKNFSNIIIGNSYPLDANLFPLTAMSCKDDHTHGVFDTLIDKVKLKVYRNEHRDEAVKIDYKCLNGNCGGRVERFSGMYKKEYNKIKEIKPIYFLMEKNSINPYTRTTKEEILYTLDSVSPKIMVEDEERDLYLQGYIEGDNIGNDLNTFNDLFVGAYNTSGFGKMKFEYLGSNEIDSIQKMKERIKKFNSYIEGSKIYIPVTLISDIYIGLEDFYDKQLFEVKTEEYIEIYNKKIEEFNNIGSVFYVNITSEIKRGFDTSKSQVRLRNAKKIIKAGSIFVLEVDKEKINYEEIFNIQLNGIGKNKIHGFGNIKICDEFHIENYYGEMKGEK